MMETTGKSNASGNVLICNNVIIPASMLVANAEEVDEEHCLHIIGSDVHLKQLDPKVRKQNEELPMFVEEKVI
jgi:hypothetical protein